MEKLDFNLILNRKHIENEIINILNNFQNTKKDVTVKRGIYIYGSPGSGKTKFIINLLKKLDCDIIKYDAGDIRNKCIIDNITQHNITDRSVISLFYKKNKPIVIVMDEIDGMNNGDKGGINSLIKLIRPKKTKKQKLENITYNPIICISNYHVDKKIKELMKVCHSFEIKLPSNQQILNIIDKMMPMLTSLKNINHIIKFIQRDIRKLFVVYNLYKKNFDIFKTNIFQNIIQTNFSNEDTKDITKNLIQNNYSISQHLSIMNDTDRTIVGLLWHENIIDILNKIPPSISIPFYIKILNNICFADYIDRITFQKQIWQFNEMSSLIKTFYNNMLFHTELGNYNLSITDIRFTKVLTKYSTEYNNYIFIQNLCQLLNLDIKDTLSLFYYFKNIYTEDEIYSILYYYDITKLDISRIYRYIDKYSNNLLDNNTENIVNENIINENIVNENIINESI